MTKTVLSKGNIVATVFLDSRGTIFVNYLEKGKIINADYYASLLQQLSHKIKEKQAHLVKKKVLSSQDNEPIHNCDYNGQNS